MAQADIQLQIPSAAFYIEPVRAFVGNLAKSLGFSRKRVADIQLVLDEICSNAVHHGSVKPEGIGPVRNSCRNPRRLKARIGGRGINPPHA